MTETEQREEEGEEEKGEKEEKGEEVVRGKERVVEVSFSKSESIFGVPQYHITRKWNVTGTHRERVAKAYTHLRFSISRID